MRRRELIGVIGAAIAWPRVSFAQERQPIRRIGVLMNLSRDDPEAEPRISAVENPLGEMGWINGKNLHIDYRWAAGDANLLRSHASELVRLGADAFLANGTPAAAALQVETRSLPIVFVHVSNPVAYGFVESFARPGGNMTGFTLLDWSVGGKWLQFLKEIAPEFTHVAVMFNPDAGIYRGLLDTLTVAAPGLGLQLVETRLRNITDIEPGCREIAAMRNAGLIVLPDPFTGAHRKVIVSAVAKHAIFAVYPFRYFAVIGGLASYGAESIDPFRRAASYLGRILNGESPANLPVQQPTKFELVINLKTAGALGLTVPPSLLTRADEVIE
jgi:putative tryptophan/tyrosine transport system substrate-binding protein